MAPILIWYYFPYLMYNIKNIITFKIWYDKHSTYTPRIIMDKQKMINLCRWSSEMCLIIQISAIERCLSCSSPTRWIWGTPCLPSGSHSCCLWRTSKKNPGTSGKTTVISHQSLVHFFWFCFLRNILPPPEVVLSHGPGYCYVVLK